VPVKKNAGQAPTMIRSLGAAAPVSAIDLRFVVKTGAMTFLEAALKILGREGRPLHFKELTERAMTKKLLTFVGRTPEVTMQTQLTAAIKKAPGNPFVRVKPGVFGLLRYPELPPEEAAKEDSAAKAAKAEKTEAPARGREKPDAQDAGSDAAGRGRRRRRRGGRGRGRDDAVPGAAASGAAEGGAPDLDNDAEGTDEPSVRGLSAAARAAALAETGVLEGDDHEDPVDDASADPEGEPMSEGEGAQPAARASSAEDLDDEFEDAPGEGDDEGDAAGSGESPGAGAAGGAEAGRAGGEELGPGRRRRRRRRRRGGSEGPGDGGPRPLELTDEAGALGDAGEGAIGSVGNVGSAASSGEAPGERGEEARSAGEGPSEAEGQGPRRIMTPVDAALEILRGQAPGRGVHVRQIADAAARRRLVHGEPNEAWRVMRAALAAEPRERLRAGQRPRVRAAGAGLFALARRPPDPELERAEFVFGEARRALRERTLAALERRLSDLPGPAFEALARVLLQREGFGPATFVKRVEGTIYLEALRGRGSRPSKALIALRSGPSSAGRRSIGELRAGIRHRGQDEGVLMLAGRLGDDAIAEWKQAGAPIEIADGQAMAETSVRHGVGVINATVSVDFVDADFFAELSEG
jgi:HB1, ASXL, restriction endonuclease HTH domain/Restriction endonuclease